MSSTAQCPKCDATNVLPACTNCGGQSFEQGPLSNNQIGVFCNNCGLGWSYVPCAKCRALIPTITFSTSMNVEHILGIVGVVIFFLAMGLFRGC